MLKKILLLVTILCINKSCGTVKKHNPKSWDFDIIDEYKLYEIFHHTKKKKGIIVPTDLRNLYFNFSDGDRRSVFGRELELGLPPGTTYRSFYHQGRSFHQSSMRINKFHLRFNLSAIPVYDKLRAAELSINSDSVFHSRTNKYRVLVHKVIRPGSKAKRTQPELWLLDSKPVNINKTKVVTLDVWPAVREWIRSPHRNFGLILEIIPIEKNKNKWPRGIFKRPKRNSQTVKLESLTKDVPLLVTYTQTGRHRRSKPGKKTSESSVMVKDIRRNRRRRNICKRHAYTMDFNDLDFGDWIRGPPTFNAYFCAGACPFPLPDILNATSHSSLRMLANNAMPGTLPTPCCAPTRVSPLTLLYLDVTRTVHIKKFENMIVEECGCI